MLEASDLRRVGALLRELAELSPDTRAGLEKWYKAAERAHALFRENYELSDALPHFVQHYLSDADIRAKDSSYRALQQEQIFAIIEELEAGRLPPPAA